MGDSHHCRDGQPVPVSTCRRLVGMWDSMLHVSSTPTDANTAASTCVSSIYTTTYGQMNPEFGISTIVGTLGLSTFVLGSKSFLAR